MKKIIVLVLLVASLAQLMVGFGIVKPLFSFSYSYATDVSIISLLIIVLAFFYMLPTIIAISRMHRNAKAIAVVNVFFGWTLVGFVGCLAWALINAGDKK